MQPEYTQLKIFAPDASILVQNAPTFWRLGSLQRSPRPSSCYGLGWRFGNNSCWPLGSILCPIACDRSPLLFWAGYRPGHRMFDCLEMHIYAWNMSSIIFNLIFSSFKQQHACDKQKMKWSVKMWNGKCDDKRKILSVSWSWQEFSEFLSAYSDTLYDKHKIQTRSYTADVVWYRQPSGQPTNMVMLNLNWLRVEEVSWQWSVSCVTVPRLSKWYDVTWCDMTWRDMTGQDVTWRGMTWHYVIWHDVTWRGMTWHEVHYVAWRDMT